MTRFKWLFYALLLIVLSGSEAHAGTVTAASCNQSDVSKALNSATSGGTTVIIPAGTCTWTTGLVYAQVGDLIIQGSGSQSTLGGGDVTVIVDAVPKGVGQDEPLIIDTIAGKSFRMTALTFQGGPSSQGTGFHGSVQISGYSQSVRIDHVHFLNLNDTNISFTGWEYGVLDHCLFDFKSINNGVRVEHANWNNGVNGDASWSDLAYYGTIKAIYIENNTFNCSTSGGCYANDADNGSHFVFRFNTLNTTHFQVHDQSTDFRAPRMFEFYNNTLTWTSASSRRRCAISSRWNRAVLQQYIGRLWWRRIVVDGPQSEPTQLGQNPEQLGLLRDSVRAQQLGWKYRLNRVPLPRPNRARQGRHVEGELSEQSKFHHRDYLVAAPSNRAHVRMAGLLYRARICDNFLGLYYRKHCGEPRLLFVVQSRQPSWVFQF